MMANGTAATRRRIEPVRANQRTMRAFCAEPLASVDESDDD
jgi:hypothetical protein